MPTNGELLEAIDRYRFAEMPDTTVVNVRWPAFERFDEALTNLARSYRDFAATQSVEADIRRYRRARVVLRSSFAAPDDPDVGLVEEPANPLAGGDLGALQSAVRDTAAALAADQHPALTALRQMFEAGASNRWPAAGTARVVVTGLGKAATERALDGIGGGSGVVWQVNSLTEARRAGHVAVTLIAGSPELMLDWRNPPEARSALVAWLFNAPMSMHVITMLWAGSLRFDSDRYEALPGATNLDPRIINVGGVELPRHLSFEDIDLPPIAARVVQPRGADDTSVESIDFMLPDRQWISFGVEDGPRPRRIDDEAEFEVEVESVPATRIRMGDVLVVLEATADRSYRRELCNEWLVGNAASFNVATALEQVDAYKRAVSRLRHRDDLIRKLVTRGLPEPYVRSQIARAVDPDTIAPQRREHFFAISEVVGIEATDETWRKVKALRAGYMHAGRVISERLRDAVRNDTSWIDLVGQQQIAQLAVENLGVVTLAPVLRVAEERAQRPESHLGVIGK